jgi:hypothetical protein
MLITRISVYNKTETIHFHILLFESSWVSKCFPSYLWLVFPDTPHSLLRAQLSLCLDCCDTYSSSFIIVTWAQSSHITDGEVKYGQESSVATDNVWLYRSGGKFWPVDLCCAVVSRKSVSLRLVSMRSETILPQKQLRLWGNRIAVISALCASPRYRLISLSLVSLCRRDKFVA